MSLITSLAVLAVLITLPLIVLFWATESRSTRINRYRAMGYTWQQIATVYGVSGSTAKRWSLAK